MVGLNWLAEKTMAWKFSSAIPELWDEDDTRMKSVLVLDAVSAWLMRVSPAVAAKTAWVCGDAYESLGSDPGATYLMDIWSGYGDAQGHPKLEAIRKACPGIRLWAWGEDAWGKDDV